MQEGTGEEAPIDSHVGAHPYRSRPDRDRRARRRHAATDDPCLARR